MDMQADFTVAQLGAYLKAVKDQRPKYSSDETRIFRRASVQMHRHRCTAGGIKKALLEKLASAKNLGFSGPEPTDGGDATINFEVDDTIYRVARDGQSTRASELEMVQMYLKLASGNMKVLSLFMVDPVIDLLKWDSIVRDKAARRKALKKLQRAKVEVENPQQCGEMQLSIRKKH